MRALGSWALVGFFCVVFAFLFPRLVWEKTPSVVRRLSSSCSLRARSGGPVPGWFPSAPLVPQSPERLTRRPGGAPPPPGKPPRIPFPQRARRGGPGGGAGHKPADPAQVTARRGVPAPVSPPGAAKQGKTQGKVT